MVSLNCGDALIDQPLNVCSGRGQRLKEWSLSVDTAMTSNVLLKRWNKHHHPIRDDLWYSPVSYFVSFCNITFWFVKYKVFPLFVCSFSNCCCLQWFALQDHCKKARSSFPNCFSVRCTILSFADFSFPSLGTETGRSVSFRATFPINPLFSPEISFSSQEFYFPVKLRKLQNYLLQSRIFFFVTLNKFRNQGEKNLVSCPVIKLINSRNTWLV